MINIYRTNTGTGHRKGWRGLMSSRLALLLGLAVVASGGLALGGWGLAGRRGPGAHHPVAGSLSYHVRARTLHDGDE